MIDISDKSVFESALILRDKYVLERDDETTVYLRLMNIKNGVKINSKSRIK